MSEYKYKCCICNKKVSANECVADGIYICNECWKQQIKLSRQDIEEMVNHPRTL